MIPVKIKSAVKEIQTSGHGGGKYIQHNTYLQLVLAENSVVLPDNIYYLKQGSEIQICRVVKGHLRVSEAFDEVQPIFLLSGSDRYQK